MTQIAIKNIKRGGKTMKINTKYDIGQRVWVIYENRGEVCIFDDVISEINVSMDYIEYWVKEAGDAFKENNIILYEDTEKIGMKVVEIMEKIREKEMEENHVS